MKIKNLMFGGMAAVFALTACQNNEDLYDPAKSEELLKSEYSANFFAKYGEVPADYSWDASSFAPRYGAATRAGNYSPEESKDWYYVEKETLDWLKTNLINQSDNSKKGVSFVMTIPNNKFTIVPIYQGQADWTWDFHVVIGTGENQEDIKMWSKHGNIQIKNNYEWGDRWYSLGTWPSNTANAQQIRSKSYTFDLRDRAGELLYFYLDVQGYDNTSSVDGMMLKMTDCPIPGNINGEGEENEAMIIACEDQKNGDKDFNEVAFLIYGDPEIPEPIEITNKEVVETREKRYMIEDLGSTDDFDFNDVVVDVKETVKKKLTLTNGVITGTEVIEQKQTATLRHLGGVLPFTLTVGDTTFDEIQGEMDKNPNTEYEIKGWIPEQNNISVAVRDKNNDNVHTVTFPENGAAPMIIAVDPAVEWMEERVSITKEWFEDLKK